MKIKDLYGCEYAEQEWYPLPRWYNQLLDLAMTKAIEFLRENPFAGELYEGEILTAIAGREASLPASYAEELKEIVDSVARKIIC